ncbi:MAG: M56 family metallopeptidase [Thermoanaerobaculia bacterium]|nr:M56 family metallopeptidase [Thermoanaerobaculia bacterium]
MTTLASLLEGSLADAIGRALVHLVWQASLVALLLAGVLTAMRRTSANARYAVACAALALTVALPVATSLFVYRPDSPVATATSPVTAANAFLADVDSKLAEPATPAAAPSSLASIPLDPALPWVVGLWLAGVTLLSARIALAFVSARRLADSGIETLPREWAATLGRLAKAMGIDRAVRLLESTRVDVPTVVGWISPVILVPASALSGLTPQQLETVLAHELAHIRRHDFVVNFLQSLVETLLFYHPAVWWMSNRVRVEREHCCDDAAVALCGDAVGYARALTSLEEMRAARVPSPALAATGGSLLERVRRLVGLGDDELASTRPIAALVALMVVSAAIAIPLSARANRAGSAAGTTIVVDAPSDDASPEVAGIWVESDAPRLALASVAPAADEFEDVFEASELAAAVLERNHAELERQLADVDRRRHDVERAIRESLVERRGVEQAIREALAERSSVEQAVREAVAERGRIEWKIATALAPVPPAPPAPAAAPSPVAAPRAWSPVPPVAPVAPVPAVRPVTPLPPIAPLAPMPHPAPTPRPAIAPHAFQDNGKPVDPDNPTVDDLIILHSAGVDAGYVREMKQAGVERLTAHQLALLSSTGVDADYAKSMRKSFGKKLTWSELLRLRALDIDEDDVAELREQGEKVDVESLTRLRGLGIEREELDRLRALADEARHLAFEVDAEYEAELAAAGLKGLSAHEYLVLRSTGVDGDWVKQMRAAGYASFSPAELAGLRATGVDGDYLRELASAGFTKLDASQLMRLRAAGIDADDLREWKAK